MSPSSVTIEVLLNSAMIILLFQTAYLEETNEDKVDNHFTTRITREKLSYKQT